jgi:hypothetical protein
MRGLPPYIRSYELTRASHMKALFSLFEADFWSFILPFSSLQDESNSAEGEVDPVRVHSVIYV